jgi:RNA polymerase sigma factor (sigma-70 family)
MKTMIRHLRQAVLSGLPDAQLLDRFLDGRDEAAFEALLRRHGPMVWGVCRRLLGNRQDIEDAFQATFLVLVRKAASIQPRGLVGHWLYGVAYRTALRARGLAAQRRSRERPLPEAPEPAATPAAQSPEWLAWLDHEVNRLPDKYRLPLVLCDLEGQPRKEVARQLQIPEGTLSSRLAHARRRLADRLSRRGVALSSAACAVLLSEEACAGAPVSVMLSTTKAATGLAAGQGAGISATVAALSTGVLQTMFLSKLKTTAVAFTLVVTLGVGGVAYRSAGVEAAPPGKAPTELEALRKENELLRLNVAVILEKVRFQEAEIQALKAELQQVKLAAAPVMTNWNVSLPPEIENAVNAFRDAPDKESRRRTAEALEKELQKFRQRLK